MSTETPVFSKINGELLGWHVTTETVYDTVRDILGNEHRVLVQQGSRLFVPARLGEKITEVPA